jgi:hypothetical protein
MLFASICQNLSRFAIATIAAVGLLTVAWPAEAKIVYTPTNITIGVYGSYNLDVNNDGVTDFTISVTRPINPPPYWYIDVSETPASENGVVVANGGAARLTYGDEIGPSQTFLGSEGLMADFVCCSYYGKPWGVGNWITKSGRGKKGYLGLSFQVNGETFYGWAKQSVFCAELDCDYALTGYAYETTPGMPIKAGHTK